MLQKMLYDIADHFPLSALETGEYRKLKVSGMNFEIQSYHASGLGHVSIMCARGFFGLMKMDTLIINPTEKDMPLFSYDRVHAMGNDTLIFELYDTLIGAANLSLLEQAKANAAALPEHNLGEHWYDSIKLPVSLSKKGRRKHRTAFNSTVDQYLEAYLFSAEDAADCEKTQKLEKASVYVEGLLEHGGPSTDVFKKGIGDEKTAQLFRTVLFGTMNA